MRHGAYGLVIHNFKILLSQKKSGPYCGLWGLPGGMIEYCENPEETVIRELKEEVALDVKKMEFFKVSSSTIEYTTNDEIHGFHHVGLIYKILEWSEIDNLTPEENFKWVKIDFLLENELTPFARDILSTMKKPKWRPQEKLRGKAIGIAIHDKSLLVIEVLDDHGKVKGWSPMGGGIEFGETMQEALSREIYEELEVEINILGTPKVYENIFTHQDSKGHEIIFAFLISFCNKEIYQRKRWQIVEQNGQKHWVEWVNINEFYSGKSKLFPEMLLKEEYFFKDYIHS